jgi:ubiquinone/menaquinone biosynthesis C-methylase UbiE
MSQKGDVDKYFDDLSFDYLQHKYLGVKRSFMTTRLERMLNMLDSHCDSDNGRKILDGGCGPGILMRRLIKKGFYLTGVDRSKEMCRLAITQLADLKNGALVVADIENLPFSDESFDVVASSGVIEYLESDDKLLRGFNRVLREDGILMISITNKYSYNLIFDSVIELMKKNRFFLSLISLIKSNILAQGKTQAKAFIIRKHSPATFEHIVRNNSFEIIDATYFYFLPFPHPFNWIWPRLCNRIGDSLERLGRTKLGILGEGYVILCKKIK